MKKFFALIVMALALVSFGCDQDGADTTDDGEGTQHTEQTTTESDADGDTTTTTETHSESTETDTQP